MAFPPKYVFTVLEAAARWDCTQAHIIEMAIADEIDLVAGFLAVIVGDTTVVGLMSVAGSEVRPLFRPHGGKKKLHVRQVRPQGSADWQVITTPAKDVKLTAADIMILASEVARFESAHGLARKGGSGPGVTPRYDWEGFYRTLLKRLYLDGMPERQRDLVEEMQMWFIETSETVAAPDESTIRRRIQSVWQDLHPE